MPGMGPGGPGGGPGGFGGGPHGGPGGPMGPMGGPMGPHGGPGGPMGGYTPGRGIYGGIGPYGYVNPGLFRARDTGPTSNRTNPYKAKTRTVRRVMPDGRVETHIEYIDEAYERKQKTLWGRIELWFKNLFRRN